MAIIIFIIILSALIIVHEVGHFGVAKKFGIRVDEFGLGYPPRAKKLFSWKGTDFTLNWLPFGGFVKIFGEDGVPEEPELPAHGQASGNSRPTPILPPDSFVSKNKGIQAAVLVAGVVANFVFAWGLISLGFMVGMPSSVTSSLPVENSETVILSVASDSPADLAGLEVGDVIVSASRVDSQTETGASEVANFIARSYEPIMFEVRRESEVRTVTVTPGPNEFLGKPVIGISMDEVGVVKLSLPKAIWHGLETTLELTILTTEAIWNLISQSVRGEGSLAGLTGPVGLVGIVGDVSGLGLIYLLSFTALISINLALINLLPFPALDGGRLLVVLGEAISRRTVPPRIIGAVNTAGFALLILLMVLVTVQDVRNIF